MKIDLDDVEAIQETTITIRGSRRRTTVPKIVVEKFGLNDGDRIRWIVFRDGGVFVTRVKGRE